MSDIKAIRAALAVNIDTVLNAGEKWIGVSPYFLSSVMLPSVQIVPDHIDYDIANARGGDVLFITVQALIADNFEQSAQDRLDRLLAGSGPLSMKAAIESDTTLGGLVDDLRVVSSDDYQVYTPQGQGASLGADWTVQIETSTEED